MNNFGAMRAAERGGQIAGPYRNTRKRQGSGGKHPFQRLSLDILHDQIRDAVFVDARIVERDDVGMREAADNLRLARELLLEVAGTKALKKRLQSDDAPDDGIARLLDAAGRAPAERLEKLVSVVHTVHKVRQSPASEC